MRPFFVARSGQVNIFYDIIKNSKRNSRKAVPEVRERGRTNYVRKKFKRHTKVQVQEMRKGLHNGKPQPLYPEEVKEQAIYYSGLSARQVGKMFGMNKANVLK